MFIIREADPKDLNDLFDLAGKANFINLPRDRAALSKKLSKSVQSFRGKVSDARAAEYIFVLEDTQAGRVVGTSAIIAQHGTPDEPHVYFSVLSKRKISKSLHMGFLHQVLRVGFDYDGPTEIGGLVLNPDYRGHADKLGLQLSYIRFAFMAARKALFQDEVLAELLPPFNERGESPLWEAIGRKFTNMSYHEADVLSRRNKEFITALFPEGDFYTCMLPTEAREAIGQVGEGTQPVRRMLEKIGFRYRSMVDPFDGGPHFWANINKIDPVKRTRRVRYANGKGPGKAAHAARGILLVFSKRGVRATMTDVMLGKGGTAPLGVEKATAEALGLDTKAEAYFLELEL